MGAPSAATATDGGSTDDDFIVDDDDEEEEEDEDEDDDEEIDLGKALRKAWTRRSRGWRSYKRLGVHGERRELSELKKEREWARVDHLMPERPDNHLCSITGKAMVDPVMTPSATRTSVQQSKIGYVQGKEHRSAHEREAAANKSSRRTIW